LEHYTYIINFNLHKIWSASLKVFKVKTLWWDINVHIIITHYCYVYTQNIINKRNKSQQWFFLVRIAKG